MSEKLRIIPRLDIKNNTIIKGIHLEGLRVVGVPAENSTKYYADGADEILYMDAVASLYERNSLKEIIEKVAENVFVPLTVGGGLRTLDDIKEVLRAGADKVVINTAAIKRPEFIREASNRFGSQCIVACIEAKKRGENKWEAYVDTGREETGVDAMEWAQQLVDLGAGEMMITSIDNEGIRKGFEIDLVKKITDLIPIPVIAHGGCGRPEDIVDLVEQSHVGAVCCSSIFHYDTYSIKEVKEYLTKHNVPVSLRAEKEYEISHH